MAEDSKRIFMIEFLAHSKEMIDSLSQINDSLGRIEKKLDSTSKATTDYGTTTEKVHKSTARTAAQSSINIERSAFNIAAAYGFLKHVVWGVMKTFGEVDRAIARSSLVLKQGGTDADVLGNKFLHAGRNAAELLEASVALERAGIRGTKSLYSMSMEAFRFGQAMNIATKDSAQFMASLKAGLNLTNDELLKTTKIVANLRLQFNASFEAINSAIMGSKGAIQSLGANVAGVSNLSAAFERMGLQGAEAGGLVSGMLENMAGPEQGRMLVSLGVNMEKFTGAIRKNNPADAIREISSSIRNLGENAYMMLKLRGYSDAQANAMINMAKNEKQLIEQMRQSSGTLGNLISVKALYRKMLNNIVDQLKLMGQELKSMAMKVGAFVVPIFTVFITAARFLLSILNLVPTPIYGILGLLALFALGVVAVGYALGKTTFLIKRAVVAQNLLSLTYIKSQWAAFQAAIGCTGLTIAQTAQAIVTGIATGAMALFNAAMLMCPAVVIAVAIMALVYVFVKLYQALFQSKTAFLLFSAALIIGLGPVGMAIVGIMVAIKVLITVFKFLWNLGVAVFGGIYDAIMEILQPIFDIVAAFKRIFSSVFESIGAMFGKTTDDSMTFFQAIRYGAKILFSVFSPFAWLLRRIVWVFKTLSYIAAAVFDAIYDAVRPVIKIFADLWQAIKDIFSPIVDMFDTISAKGTAFQTVIEFVGDAIYYGLVIPLKYLLIPLQIVLKVIVFVVRVIGALVGMIMSLGKAIYNVFTGNFGAAGDAVSEFFDYLLAPFRYLWDLIVGIGEIFTDFFSTVWEAAKFFGNALMGVFGFIWDVITWPVRMSIKFMRFAFGLIYDIITWPFRKLYDLIKWVFGSSSDSTSSFVDSLAAPFIWLWDFIKGIFKGILDVVLAPFRWIIAAAKSFVGSISGVFNFLWSAITWPFRMYVKYVKFVFGLVYDAIMWPINKIVGLFKWLFGSASSGTSSFVDTLVAPFKWFYNFIKGVFSAVLDIMLAPFRAVGAVVQWLWDKLKGFVKFIGTVLLAPFAALGAAAATAWNVIKAPFAAIGEAWDGVKAGASAVVGAVAAPFKAVGAIAKKAVSAVASMAAAPFKAVGKGFSWLWDKVAGGSEKTASTVSLSKSKINASLKALATSATASAVSSMVGKVGSGFSWLWDKVKSGASVVKNAVSSTLAKAVTKLTDTAKTAALAVTQPLNAVDRSVKKIDSSFNHLWRSVTGGATYASSKLNGVLQTVSALTASGLDIGVAVKQSASGRAEPINTTMSAEASKATTGVVADSTTALANAKQPKAATGGGSMGQASDIVVPVTLTMDGEVVTRTVARVTAAQILRHHNPLSSAFRAIPNV